MMFLKIVCKMNILKNLLVFMLLLGSFFCEAAQTGTTALDIENQKFAYDNVSKSWKNSFNVPIKTIDVIKYLSSEVEVVKGRFHLFLPMPILKLKKILNQQGNGYITKLRNNLLAYGHLGYYPNISFVPESFQKEVIVNKLIPRGIFKVNSEIANKIFYSQLNYLLPIIKTDISPLEGIGNSIIGFILEAKDFTDYNTQQIDEHNFNLEFKCGQTIGWNKNGETSNKIRL